MQFFYSHGDFLHALLCNENKNSVRVPPLSLRGYEGQATCGQYTLTGSPLVAVEEPWQADKHAGRWEIDEFVGRWI